MTKLSSKVRTIYGAAEALGTISKKNCILFMLFGVYAKITKFVRDFIQKFLRKIKSKVFF